MRRALRRLPHDNSGGVLVEAAVMLIIMFVFVLGSVDFLMAMYQWNAATKAVQLGARLAAVSSPVSSDVISITGLGGGVIPGDPMPSFTRVCNGATSSCDNGGTFDAAALGTLVRGRGSGACGDSTSFHTTGMCDVFWRVQPANVVVRYEQTGLGYAGRPGGPVPTITVSLQNINFQFFFLGSLGLNSLAIPGMTTTITGEDLSSAAPP